MYYQLPWWDISQYLDVFAGLGSCEAEASARFESKNIFANPQLLDTAHIPAIELENIKCSFHRMKARGAIFTDHLHGAVTHVVLSRQSPKLAERMQVIHVSCLSLHYAYCMVLFTRFRSVVQCLWCSFCLVQDRIRALRKLDSHNFEKRVVGYEWMEACLEEKRIVEPSPDHLIRTG